MVQHTTASAGLSQAIPTPLLERRKEYGSSMAALQELFMYTSVCFWASGGKEAPES